MQAFDVCLYNRSYGAQRYINKKDNYIKRKIKK